MEKNNSNKLLIILVMVLSLLTISFGGYIIYDKVLKEDSSQKNGTGSNNDCQKYENCEECTEIITNEIDSKYIGKYIAIDGTGIDKSYINIKEDGTFSGEYNYCHGILNIEGNVLKSKYYDPVTSKEKEILVIVGNGKTDPISSEIMSFAFEYDNNQLKLVSSEDGFDCSQATIFRK